METITDKKIIDLLVIVTNLLNERVTDSNLTFEKMSPSCYTYPYKVVTEKGHTLLIAKTKRELYQLIHAFKDGMTLWPFDHILRNQT